MRRVIRKSARKKIRHEVQHEKEKGKRKMMRVKMLQSIKFQRCQKKMETCSLFFIFSCVKFGLVYLKFVECSLKCKNKNGKL